jgi:hypothetical protein
MMLDAGLNNCGIVNCRIKKFKIKMLQAERGVVILAPQGIPPQADKN